MSNSPLVTSYEDAPSPAALIEMLADNPASADFLATHFPGQDTKQLLGTFNHAITTMNFAVLNKLGQATMEAGAVFAVATNTTPTRGPKCALRGMRCIGKTMVLSYMRAGELGFFDLRYGVESSACGGVESGREGFGGDGPREGNGGTDPVDPGVPEDPNYIEPVAWPTMDTLENMDASDFILAEYRSDTGAKWTPVRISDASPSISQANKTPMPASTVKALDIEVYPPDYSSGQMTFGPASHFKALAVDHRMNNPLFATEASRLYGEIDEGVYENLDMMTAQLTRVVAPSFSPPIKAAMETYVNTNKTLMYHQQVKQKNFDIDIDFLLTNSEDVSSFNRANNVLWIGLKPKGDGTYIDGFPIAFGRVYTPQTMSASDPDYSPLAMNSSKIVGTLPSFEPDSIYFAVPTADGQQLQLIGYYSPLSTSNNDQIVAEKLGVEGSFMATRPGVIAEGMSAIDLFVFDNGTPTGIKPGAYSAPAMRKSRMKVRVIEDNNRTIVAVSVFGQFGNPAQGEEPTEQWNIVGYYVFDDVRDLKGYVAIETTKRETLENVALRATNPTSGIVNFKLSNLGEQANGTTTQIRIANGKTFKGSDYINNAQTKPAQESALRNFLSRNESAAILRQGFTTRGGGVQAQARNAVNTIGLKETFVFTGNDGFDMDLNTMVVYYGEPFDHDYFRLSGRMQDSVSGLGAKAAVAGKGSYIRMGSTIDPKYAESFIEWLHGNMYESTAFTAVSSKTQQSASVFQLILDDVFFERLATERRPAMVPIVVEFEHQGTGSKCYYSILVSMDPTTNMYTCWSAREISDFDPGEITVYTPETTEPGVDVMNQEEIFKVLRPITTDFNTVFSEGEMIGVNVVDQVQAFVAPLTAESLEGEEFTTAAGSYFDPLNISYDSRFDIIAFHYLTKDLKTAGLIFDVDRALPVEENILFGTMGYTEVEAPTPVDGRVRPSSSITTLKYYTQSEANTAPAGSPVRVLGFLPSPQVTVKASTDESVGVIAVYNGVLYDSVYGGINSGNIAAAEVLRGYRNYVMPVRVTVRDNNEAKVRAVFYMTFAIGGQNRLGTAWLTPHAIVDYVPTLTPSTTSVSLASGELDLTLALKRNGLDYEPTTDVFYESSNEAVATVNSSGQVTLVGEGTFTITASEPPKWEIVSETITVTA